MNKQEVIKLIDSAFQPVCRPETSLRQFQLTDLYGMVREVTDEEWRIAEGLSADQCWQDIPISEIEECGCLLAHMEAHEFQYYLAAYMCYCVNHVRQCGVSAEIIGGTVFSLYPSRKNDELYKYKMAQFSLLTSQQKRAIVEFLKFISSMADEFQGPEAERTLSKYWGTQSVDT